MVVPVSGDQSQTLEPGCYQSTIFEGGVYFPQAPSDSQSFGSLSGTLGTLRVGDGLDCAKPGAAVEVASDELSFDADGTSELKLSCELLADDCAGKATVDLAKTKGRIAYGGCKRCNRIAAGHYSVPAGTSGKLKLKLTKAGEKLLGRGGCKRCARQVARGGGTVGPSVQIRRRGGKCSHCRVAQLTVKDTRTGGKTRSSVQIRPRGGKCIRCRQAAHAAPRPSNLG